MAKRHPSANKVIRALEGLNVAALLLDEKIDDLLYYLEVDEDDTEWPDVNAAALLLDEAGGPKRSAVMGKIKKIEQAQQELCKALAAAMPTTKARQILSRKR